MAVRTQVIVMLVVFVVIVYGITFMFADRFPDLAPRGIGTQEDIIPLGPAQAETQAAIEQEQDVQETPPEECTGILCGIFQLFAPLIIPGLAIAGLVIDTLDQATAGAITSFGNSVRSFFTLFVSVVTFDLPALSGDPVFNFLRLVIVVPIIAVVTWLVFSVVRSLIPFLPGGA